MNSVDVILASGSPRRGAILTATGLPFVVMVPTIDDADAPTDHVDARRCVMSLAWFKAKQVLADALPRYGQSGPRWILAADTMCVRDEAVLGKPADPHAAELMIRAFCGRSHRVVTGICIVDRFTQARRIFADSAEVALGELSEPLLAAHLASGAWRGKAGGYNYSDCLAAGWPLKCTGDPETVMGLPSRLVVPVLRSE